MTPLAFERVEATRPFQSSPEVCMSAYIIHEAISLTQAPLTHRSMVLEDLALAGPRQSTGPFVG